MKEKHKYASSAQQELMPFPTANLVMIENMLF